MLLDLELLYLEFKPTIMLFVQKKGRCFFFFLPLWQQKYKDGFDFKSRGGRLLRRVLRSRQEPLQVLKGYDIKF